MARTQAGTSSPGMAWYKELSPDQIRGFFGAWMGYALDGFDFVLISYVLTDIAKEFDLSLPVAATLVGAAFTTRWIGGPLFGSIADRFGRKTAMILAVWTYSVGTALCGLSIGYWSLFVFRAVVGLGMAGEYSASAIYAIETWPAHMRNKASGLVISGYAVGGLLSSLIYPLIVPSFGWRSLFFLGLLPVLLTFWLRRGIEESPEWAASDAAREHRPSFYRLLTRRYIGMTALLCLTVFSAFSMNWPLAALLPTYLKSIGYDPTHVGTIMFIANVGLLFGYAASGFLGDRFGTVPVYVTALVLSLVFIVPVFAIGHTSILLLGGLVFCLLFFGMGVSGIFPKWIAWHYPTEIRGAGLGLSYNVGAFGGFLAPTIGAGLQSTLGLGPAIGFLVTCWTLLTILLIGLDIPRRLGGGSAAEEHHERPAMPFATR